MSSVHFSSQWKQNELALPFPSAPDVPQELLLEILRNLPIDTIAARCSALNRSWYTIIHKLHYPGEFPRQIALCNHVAQSFPPLHNPPEEVRFWSDPKEGTTPSNDLCHLINCNDFDLITQILMRYIQKKEVLYDPYVEISSESSLGRPLETICKNLFSACFDNNNIVLPLRIVRWLENTSTFQWQSSLSLCRNLNSFVIKCAFPLPNALGEPSIDRILLQLQQIIDELPPEEKLLLWAAFFSAYMRHGQPYEDKEKSLDVFFQFNALLNEEMDNLETYAEKGPCLTSLLNLVRARTLFICFLRGENKRGWDLLNKMPENDQISIQTYLIPRFFELGQEVEFVNLGFRLFDQLLTKCSLDRIPYIIDSIFILDIERTKLQMSLDAFVQILSMRMSSSSLDVERRREMENTLRQKFQARVNLP